MDSIRNFWDDRSKLGSIAGSNDYLLKELEQKLILDTVKSNSKVIEIGCGNGDTLIKLAKNKFCNGTGFDFSEGMINIAKTSAVEEGINSAISFEVGTVPGLTSSACDFDYALTERCLINLDSYEKQHQAFIEIMNRLKVGGYYLMIESFAHGLERINNLRTMLGLDTIDQPWHNLFMDEDIVNTWIDESCSLVKIIPFSSTYYFLSRVVHAALAHEKGEELRYDSEINLLSCKLPPIGDLGPARFYLWQRIK